MTSDGVMVTSLSDAILQTSIFLCNWSATAAIAALSFYTDMKHYLKYSMYSRISMAQTPIARLPRLFRPCS